MFTNSLQPPDSRSSTTNVERDKRSRRDCASIELHWFDSGHSTTKSRARRNNRNRNRMSHGRALRFRGPLQIQWLHASPSFFPARLDFWGRGSGGGEEPSGEKSSAWFEIRSATPSLDKLSPVRQTNLRQALIESPIHVPETQLAFHQRAQRNSARCVRPIPSCDEISPLLSDETGVGGSATENSFDSLA